MKKGMERTPRTRNEIIASILESANGGGANMQKLMYNAYMSHGILKKYLALMIEIGLVEQDSISRTFQTTSEGIQFLRIHNRLVELMRVRS